MSNALPMALRPAARFTHQWNSVTSAFARRYCAQPSCSPSKPQPSILWILQTRSSPLSSRSFSTTPRFGAKVHNPPNDPPPAPQAIPQRKRTVKVGPLPNGVVGEPTIKHIFGSKVSYQDGNAVLRILHHRRTSGSLADYGVANLGSQYSYVSQALAVKALEWLRRTYPIDEAAAAVEWAEKEANRIAYELWLADPENESKYKDPARAFREQQLKEKEEEEQQEQEEQRIGMLRVGPSQFDRNIEEKRRRRLEEVTRKAEEKEQKAKEEEKLLATGEWVRTPTGTQLMKPGQTTYIDVFGREQVSRRKETMEKYQKMSETPFKDEQDMLSKTTLVQRLYPMTAFVLVVCLISYGIAHFYVPPAPEYRLWPDLSPTTATMAALVGANVFLAIAWRWTPLWPFLTRYFMHVPGYPRAVQAVGNIFSHIQYEHLLSNMMFLCLVGPVCHDLVNRSVFLGTYVSAGAVGTLASLYWANLGRGNITAHSVGASAAIWGIGTLYCLLTEQDTIKIPFVKDKEVGFYPKMLFLAFVAMELHSATRKRGKANMDHASHFGGMAVGMGVAGYLRMTGFHQRKGEAGVQEKAGVEEKTVDVGAIVKEEIREVKQAVGKAVGDK